MVPVKLQLKTIIGLLKPSEGTVLFNGKDITGLSADRMAANGLVLVLKAARFFRI
jgi:ABC-type branched-subunit amino acid transport system ATPase component